MTTKKDFIAFAKMIKAQLEKAANPEERRIIEEIARQQAQVYKADNPRFDFARFCSTCGI